MRTTLSAAALAALLLAAGVAQSQERPDRPAFNAEEKYFGTDAFVPDWRKAEDIDTRAAQRFLERHWPDFRASHDAGNQGGSPAGLTAEEKAAGVVAWPVEYFHETPPGKVPTPAERKPRSLAVFAARGESEPFVIAVRALEAARTVSVEATDLTAPDGTISKADITCRLALAWEFDFRQGRQWVKRPQQVVMLKPPDGRWKSPPNYTLAWWVDVHVPAGAKPGRYAGKITVAADGRPAATFEAAVEVLPFALKTNNFHAGCFSTTFGLFAGGLTGYYEEMMEMDARYGYNMAGPFFNKGDEVPFTGTMEKMQVNAEDPRFKKLDATLQLLKAHGMGQVLQWTWGGGGKVERFNRVLKGAGVAEIGTEEGKRGFAHMLRAIKEAEAKYSWPEIVITPYDETMMDQAAVRDLMAAAALARKISPESRLYMVEWCWGYTRLYQSSGKTLTGSRTPDDHGGEYKALAASGEKPVYNFPVIGSNLPDAEARAIQDGFGAELWNFKEVSRVRPQARYAQGFGSYVTRSEASQLWANYRGNFDTRDATMHYLMPDDRKSKTDTRGPVIAGVRAAIAREGIDDRKYIETLKYHARTRKSAEDLKYLHDELPARCAALADLKGIGGLSNVEETVTDPAGMPKLRAEIKERILRLLK